MLEVHIPNIPSPHSDPADDRSIRVQDDQGRMKRGVTFLHQYDGTEYTYPAWAHWTGRILAASTMSCIPIGAIIALYKARVSLKIIFFCSWCLMPTLQKPEGSSNKRSLVQCFGAAITPSYEPTPDDQNVR